VAGPGQCLPAGAQSFGEGAEPSLLPARGDNAAEPAQAAFQQGGDSQGQRAVRRRHGQRSDGPVWSTRIRSSLLPSFYKHYHLLVGGVSPLLGVRYRCAVPITCRIFPRFCPGTEELGIVRVLHSHIYDKKLPIASHLPCQAIMENISLLGDKN